MQEEYEHRRSYFGGALGVLFMIFIICVAFGFISVLTNELSIYNYRQGYQDGIRTGSNMGHDNGFAEGYGMGHTAGMLEMMQLFEGERLRKQQEFLEQETLNAPITQDTFPKGSQ